MEHKITGSPGTNSFRVDGPGLIGGLTTNLFALEGKINTGTTTAPPPPPSGPAITVTPATIGYGNQRIGLASAAKHVTVKNTGTAKLVIAGRRLGATNPDEYRIDPTGTTCNANTSVAPGASCGSDVRLLPTSLHSKPATLNIRSDASNASVDVSLSGTGVLL